MPSNKPIVLSIPVHGSSKYPYYLTDSRLLLNIEALYRRRGFTVMRNPHDIFDWTKWSKNLLNNPIDRKEAAAKLAFYIDNQLSSLQQKGELPKNVYLSLLGHSHGGNVAIQALQFLPFLEKKYNVSLTVHLTTCNTPAYTSTQRSFWQKDLPLVNGRNAEDPMAYQSVITTKKFYHNHIAIQDDYVVQAARGENTYDDNSISKNLVFNGDTGRIVRNDKTKIADTFIAKPDNNGWQFFPLFKSHHRESVKKAKFICEIIKVLGLNVPNFSNQQQLRDRLADIFPSVLQAPSKSLRPQN
jgi:hypothetical protein